MPRINLTPEEHAHLAPILEAYRHKAELDATWNAALVEAERVVRSLDESVTLDTIADNLKDLRR